LDHDGNKRYNIVCGRDGITYTPKKLKERKDTSWRTEICEEVLQVRNTDVIFIQGFGSGSAWRPMDKKITIFFDQKLEIKFPAINLFQF
jgi:hypothetical protein